MRSNPPQRIRSMKNTNGPSHFVLSPFRARSFRALKKETGFERTAFDNGWCGDFTAGVGRFWWGESERVVGESFLIRLLNRVGKREHGACVSNHRNSNLLLGHWMRKSTPTDPSEPQAKATKRPTNLFVNRSLNARVACGCYSLSLIHI